MKVLGYAEEFFEPVLWKGKHSKSQHLIGRILNFGHQQTTISFPSQLWSIEICIRSELKHQSIWPAFILRGSNSSGNFPYIYQEEIYF